jgi:hypothetical protein
MSVLVGLSLTNHCLDHSEIFFKSVFTILHKLEGNLLQWLGRYILAREQQVIIKDAISGKGNLKAGVPQRSILGPFSQS